MSSWQITGKKGCSYLEEEPDLVLFDVVLPEMNGLEICKCIGRRRKQPLPIIVLSSHVNEDYGLKAGAWGHDYIVKPFNLREL